MSCTSTGHRNHVQQVHLDDLNTVGVGQKISPSTD